MPPGDVTCMFGKGAVIIKTIFWNIDISRYLFK